MNYEQNEYLDQCLGYWASIEEDNFGELRSNLWFPSSSAFSREKGGVESSDDDPRISYLVQIITGGIKNLNADQSSALRQSLGLRTIGEIENYTRHLTEARAIVWKALTVFAAALESTADD